MPGGKLKILVAVLLLATTALVTQAQQPAAQEDQQKASQSSSATTPAPTPAATPAPSAAPSASAAPQSPQNAPASDAVESEKPPELPPTNDPKEIIRRAIDIDHRTLELARSYTCRQREVLKNLDKHGNVKSTEIKTWDVTFYYGQEYSRLVQKDDKPLSEKEQKKEDEKLEKFLSKYRNESESDREHRLAKEKKEREKGRLFVRDMLAAYDFRIVGEEPVDGVDTWVIEATPRKDFHPTQPHADILSKAKGKLWIEKQGYNWVKVEGEVLETISFGWFVARIHPGSRFVIDKTHLNNEVWLPRRFYVNGGIRIALVKNELAEQEDILSDFKKFATSSRILPGVKEVPESVPPAVPTARPTPTPAPH
jgi:chemotaxis protein histidine kinase CheA